MNINKSLNRLKDMLDILERTENISIEENEALSDGIEALEILSSMPDIEIRRYKEKFKSFGAFKYADTDSIG